MCEKGSIDEEALLDFIQSITLVQPQRRRRRPASVRSTRHETHTRQLACYVMRELGYRWSDIEDILGYPRESWRNLCRSSKRDLQKLSKEVLNAFVSRDRSEDMIDLLRVRFYSIVANAAKTLERHPSDSDSKS